MKKFLIGTLAVIALFIALCLSANAEEGGGDNGEGRSQDNISWSMDY